MTGFEELIELEATETAGGSVSMTDSPVVGIIGLVFLVFLLFAIMRWGQ